ncbi:hypothetical protein Mterra_01882 [Calidithermus terrae]|uniref:Uncharacterized protein n=1 Tax=Calidithermus terrae TaxID=1408545 RepID=A0A399EQ74_9DEIN|nr:hypothetical protein [Calidithermus terrae]RIH84702.1 hypothetical protein Mterra_01882 [Calidithermus terrae]
MKKMLCVLLLLVGLVMAQPDVKVEFLGLFSIPGKPFPAKIFMNSASNNATMTLMLPKQPKYYVIQGERRELGPIIGVRCIGVTIGGKFQDIPEPWDRMCGATYKQIWHDSQSGPFRVPMPVVNYGRFEVLHVAAEFYGRIEVYFDAKRM